MDNYIHFTNGFSGGDVVATANQTAAPLSLKQYDLKYDPRTHELLTVGGRAQFGLAFDDIGNKFICSNRAHIQHVVMHPRDGGRNPYAGISSVINDIPAHGAAAPVFALSEARTTAFAHVGTFTAACGLVIYRGTALGKNYYGNGFVCEPTANLVHRDVLNPNGPSFTAQRAQNTKEFIATTDTWFRPVFLANGPDGALYLCDMYRETIEHPQYLPPEISAVTDFGAG